MTLSTPIPSETILDRMPALSDSIRCRILLLLERHELAVTEICATLQLPQSTVSRHLKVLATDGWVGARREGTSRLYSVQRQSSPSAESLWQLVRIELLSTSSAEEDLRRLEAVLANRSSASKAFFSSAASRWSEMRRDLFGSRFDLEALLALLDRDLVVGDLGAGTGQVVASLAPHVRQVIAIDESAEMLEAASERLAGTPNVELRHGTLEDLPIADESLDAALLVLVLHHLAEPRRVLCEAARVLKPGGRLLLVDMLPHGREEYRLDMGHVWLGFEESQVVDWLQSAGFVASRFIPLRPEPEMLGPSLFASSGVRAPADEATTANAAGTRPA